MDKDSRYYVDGTNFEVQNCPARLECSGICEMALSNNELKSDTHPGEKKCKYLNCPIKSHMVHLSALINVCEELQSNAIVGAKACFDDFIIKKF